MQQQSMNLQVEIDHRRSAELEATKLAAIVESSDDAIVSKDLNGIVSSWNAGAERMFGFTAAEMVGQPITRIIPAEYRQDEDMILGRIRRAERVDHFETVRMTKDGRRIEVSVTVSPIKDASGRVVGAAKIARDITERKRTVQALHRTEKLAATGQLAASIAHEINNPMQALSNLLTLIAYRTTLDENTRQLVALAESELTRMSHISRQMLSFYRESATPVPVEMHGVLEDILELHSMRMRSNDIKVERRYQNAGPIHAFPVEMRQLFSNLVGNAIEAVGERGRIVVRVREVHAADVGRGVRVTIADNGHGIAPGVRARIFEPFFTTKAEKGTGLGLWVVKGVIAKHEGKMWLRSSTQPGRSGTVFSIFLPAQVASHSVSAAAGIESAVRR
jgi:two-component system CheB/CheR fusion protein